MRWNAHLKDLDVKEKEKMLDLGKVDGHQIQ